MVMIRRYGEFPAVFVPDEGEVVLASRSAVGPYLRAAVTRVRRRRGDFVRVDFVWLESASVTPSGSGHRVGEKGHVFIHRDDQVPLIRRLPADRD
jgi:hypothetical protein